jgi:hypothetical protein
MDTFPAGGFDSLSAVEMSGTLSTALGMQLPGTLVFDYPSVSAMAQYIHSLLAPAQQAHNSSATVGSELVCALSSLGPAAAGDDAPAGRQLISPPATLAQLESWWLAAPMASAWCPTADGTWRGCG